MSAAPARINPFPGLRPFTQEEDFLFFGREEQTIELLQRLSSNRFVAVVGTSGSGKSSLVRCGLLSELLGGRMLEAGASWEVAITHPGGNPLALLTDALLEADLYNRETENARENLLATLSRSHFGLVEAVKQASLGEGTNFLLVVDQFEEIFRFHEAGQTQQEAASEFVSLLLETAAQKQVPIYIVLTMRSDFIGECSQFEGLAERVNRGEFLIPRLTREQYKRVIEGPIKVAGGRIAPRLLQRLLNDLGQQADQLPCLQHALMRTWDVCAGKADAEALDLDDYQRIGKMSQALSLHADEIYQSLPGDRERMLCRGLFQALTVEESNSRGIRRPQRLGRLCEILEVGADELLPIIDAYRKSGVTFLMPAPQVVLTDQTIIDISHESLMRVWTRLRQWVEEETQAAGIYHRLSESAALHEQGKAGLYRDPELAIALAWRESRRPNAAWAERYRPGFTTAMAFLETSQQASVAEEQARQAARQRELEQARQLAEAQQLRLEQQVRAARRLRKLIVGLAVVAVIAVLACFVALIANQRANTQAANAREYATRAHQSQTETASALAVAESQKAKAQAAEQAARTAEEEGRKLLYTTDMQLVPFIWKDPMATAAVLRNRLDAHDPEQNERLAGKDDLRGFEWRYYHHVLENGAVLFRGHAVSVIDAAFASKGQLVTLDQNGQIRKWDSDSQDEDKASRRDLPSGPGVQLRVLSPGGERVALVEGNKVHLFDTSTGQQTIQIDSSNTPSRRVIFSRDTDRLVIVDSKIRWCSVATGEVIAAFDREFDRIGSLALSADGLTLAVVGYGGGQHYSLFRLDATTKSVEVLAQFELTSPVSVSALSPDGRRFVMGEPLRGSIHGFATDPYHYNTWHGSAHASPVAAVAFSGDGAKLATADTQGNIKIWDAQKLTKQSMATDYPRAITKYEQEPATLTLKSNQEEINSVAFSSDGKRLVSTSADGTAAVWDLENAGAAIRPLERYGWSLMSPFSPDGQLIAASTGSRRGLALWDATTGRIVRELSADTNGFISRLAFSPTDNHLLAVGQYKRQPTARQDGQQNVSTVALWDIDAGTELARLPEATESIGALAFSPDGKYLAGSEATTPNALKVWEVSTRRVIQPLSGGPRFCWTLNFSPDGTLLASGEGPAVVIRSTTTWSPVQNLPNPDQSFIQDTTFSPDGKILAMATDAGNIYLWDVATGKLLETLKGHSSHVAAVAFSPDGRTLASGSVDQTVRLWNVATRRELMQLDSGSVELGTLFALAFSPDGKQLMAGGWAGGIWSTEPIIWNDPERAAKKLRSVLSSNADFRNRIRMLSENLQIHEALEKLDSKNAQVQAALAATRANWHAAHGRWAEAATEYDRLQKLNPDKLECWLRTPGLIRVATALFYEDRPAQATALLTGGAKRRAEDGLPPITVTIGLGITHEKQGDVTRITALDPGSPAARSKLQVGDILLKVNDVEVTDAIGLKLADLLKGPAGKTVRLTVRHPGSDQAEEMELLSGKYLLDPVTGDLWRPLLAAIETRLAKDPQTVGLRELRAELAGQWSNTKAQ